MTLHSLEGSRLKCSATGRVPDYYDTIRNPVFLGFLEVIHMIEPETQDQLRGDDGSFLQKVQRKSLHRSAYWE